MATCTWEYLEVAVDLSRKTWKDSSGRREKLRKGNTAPLLSALGLDGWELSGTVPLDRSRRSYRLYFKRLHAGTDESGAGESGEDQPRE